MVESLVRKMDKDLFKPMPLLRSGEQRFWFQSGYLCAFNLLLPQYQLVMGFFFQIQKKCKKR